MNIFANQETKLQKKPEENNIKSIIVYLAKNTTTYGIWNKHKVRRKRTKQRKIFKMWGNLLNSKHLQGVQEKRRHIHHKKVPRKTLVSCKDRQSDRLLSGPATQCHKCIKHILREIIEYQPKRKNKQNTSHKNKKQALKYTVKWKYNHKRIRQGKCRSHLR